MKRTQKAKYYHRDAEFTAADRKLMLRAWSIGITTPDEELCALDPYNIIKIANDGGKVSFLYYPDLLTATTPRLARSVVVNLDTEKIQEVNYTPETAPILHRKELILGQNP